MLSELRLDLVAAQGFAIVFMTLGFLGALSAVGLTIARGNFTRATSLVALVSGTLCCLLAASGFAVTRMRTTEATTGQATLPPTTLERILRTGDVEAQRIAEPGVVDLSVDGVVVLRVMGRGARPD